MQTSLLWVVCGIIGCCVAYPTGPPLTTNVCNEMFPEHGVDSQIRTTPYEIDISQNMYSPWEELRITVKPREVGYTIKGIMIQARRAGNCTRATQRRPIGIFQLNANEKFLKTMQCDNRFNSTLSHLSNTPLAYAVFKWYAPDVPMGHLYFVATIVSHKNEFWTGVYSPIIRDLKSPVDLRYASYCPVRKLVDRNRQTTTTTRWPWVAPVTQRSRSGASPLLHFSQSLSIFVTILFASLMV